MPEGHCVISKCDYCQQENNISLIYFVDFDTKFEKSVIAKCQTCSKGFIVTFDESMVQ